jgi:hypothetical protein
VDFSFGRRGKNLHFQFIPEFCHVDKITGRLKS